MKRPLRGDWGARQRGESPHDTMAVTTNPVLQETRRSERSGTQNDGAAALHGEPAPPVRFRGPMARSMHRGAAMPSSTSDNPCRFWHSSARRTAVVASLALVALGGSAELARAQETGSSQNAIAQEPNLPSPLSLQQALSIAQTRGFDMALADASIQSARADVTSARALANPTLSLTGGRTFHYDASACPGCSALAWSVSLSDDGAISDIVFGKRGLRGDVAWAGVRTAQALRADTLRALTFAVRRQYLTVAATQRSVALERRVLLETGKTRDLAQIRFQAGDVSEADVLRAQAAVLQAQQDVTQADSDLRVARSGLAVLLGVRSGRPTFAVDDSMLDSAPQAKVDAAAIDSLLRQAMANRPDLAAAEAQVRQAEMNLDLQRRTRVPPIGLFVGYSQEGAGQSAIQPPTVTLGVSAPLPVIYQSQGEIGKAQAALWAARLAREQLRAQITADVDSAVAKVQGAQSRLGQGDALVETAAQAKDLLAAQYQKGAASLLDVLEAQRSYVLAERQRLDVAVEAWTAHYELAFAAARETSS